MISPPDGSDPTPKPESPKPEVTSDPITLPAIENLGTLWFILGAIVVAVFVIFAVLFLTRAGRKEARARLERRAIEDEFASRWLAVKDLHQKMLRKITHAETDWDTLFFMPALSDMGVPATRKLYDAYREAENASDAIPRTPVDDISVLAYPKAVYAFQAAWDAAEREARRIGQSRLTREERKTIKEIKNLLAIAENSAASPNEREIAYRRVQNLVKTLTQIVLPQAALAAIEAGLTKTLEIEAAPEKVIAL